MFDTLTTLVARPALFEGFDTAALWANPHVSEKILRLHFDETSELASRPAQQSRAMVERLPKRVPMDGKRLTDLGCGPGLSAKLFAETGANITGIDVSERSIKHG